MANRQASAFRKRLLVALIADLGPEWRLHGPSLIYRFAPPYLVQWISLDSSRFSIDFNVSCYVQILAHQADFWSGHLGGRIKGSHGGDLRLSIEGDPPIAELAEAIRTQARPSVSSLLDLQTVSDIFADAKPIGDDAHFGWCFGLILGLMGQMAPAKTWIDTASRNLDKLRKAWAVKSVAPADWAEAGAWELSLLSNLLADQAAFERHCKANAESNTAALGLVSGA